jgi:hypothetical protein
MPEKGGFKMEKNQSDTERFIRIIIGGALLLSGTYIPMSVVMSWGLMLFGLVLMLTGLAGYCPCYAVLGMNSNK